MTTMRIVHITGYATVQDHGRPGHAHLSVPPSGAFDRDSHDFANRLVGNRIAAATLEMTRATVQLSFDHETTIAVTGAPASIVIDGRQRDMQRAVIVPAHTTVLIATQHLGMRTYLAVRGGVSSEPVMDSRSYDELSRIGTPPVDTGTVLGIGTDAEATPAVARQVSSGVNVSDAVTLHVHKGPRWGYCSNADDLLEHEYTVTAQLNRIGLRLAGTPITWNTTERLPSEGMLTGAIQIAADGQPIIFGPDHPTTGGYPVIAVLDEREISTVAQLAPGTTVRFTQARR
jgi:biotin-dependent carboxylase-like uncharacterized protein